MGGGKGEGRGAGRALHVRVRTARKRSVSSAQWLERQLNDPYVARSKREGYRSRAAYKLIEIDDKHRLLGPGKRVVDLGAAPGGWTQVAVARTGSTDADPFVVALDILPMERMPGAIVIQKDMLAEDAPDAIREALRGHGVDLVLSDMAAPTVGHRQTDHLRIVNLFEAAAAFAIEVLEPGGHFLAKVFQGGAENELLALLKRHFDKVIHVKPPASRSQSAELYLLAKGFKGRQ
ncbi:MAG: RlmE family RNA methyltransferase [Bauldia sp.]|nr:RlmE family RNA methyltransferase [Bauldia sp.]